MQVLLVLLVANLAGLCWAATNRTSCFHYITCMEDAHQAIRECVGSTILALALESNEKPFAEFLKGREEKSRSCEESLSSDSLDFEALQGLVYDDSRNCFKHLPLNRHNRPDATRTCRWDGAPATLPEERRPLECLAAFRGQRRQCEELLQCCPDHTRCGERMNTISIAYQHAKSKSNEIVERLLLCLGSLEPSTVLELAGMKVDRLQFRIPGLPFYKPARSTEERIARRLSMMSYSVIDEKKDRFIKKFEQKRDAIVAKRVASKIPKPTIVSQASTPITSEERVAIVRNLFRNATENELAVYASLLAEGNFARLAELEREKNSEATGPELQRIREVSLLSKDPKTIDFLVPATLETARKEQSQHILEEQMPPTTTPSNVENKKPSRTRKNSHRKNVNKKKLSVDKPSLHRHNTSAQEQLPSRKANRAPPGHFNGILINLLKEDDIIASPHTKTTYKNLYKNQKIPLDASKAVSVTAMTGKTTMTTIYMNGTSVTQTIAEEIVTSPEPPLEREQRDFSSNRTTSTFNETLASDIEGSAASLIEELNDTTETSLMPSTIEADTAPDENDLETAVLLSGEEEHLANDDKNFDTLKKTDSKASIIKVNKEEQKTEGIEIEAGAEKEKTAGSQGAQEDISSEDEGESNTGEDTPDKDEDTSVAPVEEIPSTSTIPSPKKRNDNTGTQRMKICVRFAACMETIRDYENECEQRFSRDFLTHGIDDGDVLRILNVSSVSRGMLAHRACLRFVGKSDYATVKHLLVTQRSLRKTCLEHSNDKRRMSTDEMLQCQKPLPSTETIDDFLFKNHYRTETNRELCHAYLKESKEACYSLAVCCRTIIKSCEDQLNSSQLQERLRESVDRLIQRHNDCEKKMIETLRLFRNFGDDKQQTGLTDFRS